MPDKYADYEELEANEEEGVDYLRRWEERDSHFIHTAIHGGSIESGTTEVAEYLAGDEHNFYTFEGIKSSGNFDLHITSTNFDEPNGLRMAARSDVLFSWHGMSGSTKETHIGGLDIAMRNAVWEYLEDAGFTVVMASDSLNGEQPDNFTNRTLLGNGVQLELTTEQRKAFFEDNDFSSSNRENKTQEFYDYCDAVNKAIEAVKEERKRHLNTPYQAKLNGDINTNLGFKSKTRKDLDNHVNDISNPHSVNADQVSHISPLDATVTGDNYPIGVTAFEVENDDSWPNNYGTVLNVKSASDRFTQWFYYHGYTDSYIGAYFRHYHSNNGWSAWQELTTKAALDDHTTDTANPHSVTKTQVGLGNVTDDQQATKTEFDSHTSDTTNPHSVTKSQVGLGNVTDNEQATKTEFDNHVADTANPHSVDAEQISYMTPVDATITGDNYPVGVTTFDVNDDTSWPNNYGSVLNVKADNDRFTQWFYMHGYTSSYIGAWYRHYHSNNGWSAWQEMTTVDYVDGQTGDLSTLTTDTQTDLVSAVNEVDGNADTNTTNIGTLSNLTTDDQSSLVSAVNEVNGKFVEYDKGTSTQSGDDTATSFTIAHGLSATPSFFTVQESSADAGTAEISYVTADSTNITVNFKSAPVSGTDNVAMVWKAEV